MSVLRILRRKFCAPVVLGPFHLTCSAHPRWEYFDSDSYNRMIAYEEHLRGL